MKVFPLLLLQCVASLFMAHVLSLSHHQDLHLVHAQQQQQEVDWSSLTSSQLHALSPSVFETASAFNISQIPSEACSGFRSDQLNQLNGAACAGFISTDCFMNISGEAFSGISSNCLINILPSTIKVLTSDQLRNIPANSMIGLTATQLSVLNPDTCIGFSAAQISNLQSSPMFDSCYGFSEGCFLNLPLTSLNGMSYSCLASIPKMTLIRMDSSRFASLSMDTISSLKPDLFQLFSGETCAGFNDKSLSVLPYDTCRAFTEMCFSYMTPQAIQGMQPLCLRSVPRKSLRGLDADRIRMLPNFALSLVNPDQISELYMYRRGDILNGLTLSQAQAISTNTISVLKTMFLNGDLLANDNLPQDFRRMNWLHLSSTASAYTSAKITPSSIIHMPTFTFVGFLGIQIQQLPGNIFENATDGQISAFDCEALSGLSATQISFLSPRLMCIVQPKLFENCVKTSSIIGVTTEQFLESFSCGQLSLSCPQFHALSKSQYNFLVFMNQTNHLIDTCGPNVYSSGSSVKPHPSHSSAHTTALFSCGLLLFIWMLLITFSFIH
ncbi:hypothetical protein FDP41_010630 [Naegleria fowleri]|uniref:Surface antigen BspA-like n=1 Tax=Naegleria fowleri TaxID=5763 RepID=A0A6A5CDX5_NAEFO|nr:uncharacterized protein FDP41_010630 [Naegleria fowleri]KAF0983565.1 hypothetical protein FDP41_010630 [Naegleria fowleri]CAG4713695.1 unnamed protein product [Naegleria fowleri]